MTDSYVVGDLVAEFLQAAGVETAFGVVSVHNTPMLDAIGRRNAIRFVPARGEAGAGSMADAAARVTKKPAAAFSSTGPGAANIVGALVEARFAGAPVIHLTGQTATKHLGKGRGAVHDVPDQLGMLSAVSKAAFRVETPETALGTLSKAVTAALTPPTGPVSIEIPIDIQKTKIDRPAALDNLTLSVPAPMPPSDAALDALVTLASQAKRPLLWLGNGATGAGEATARLLDLGFGLVTSLAGRAVVPEDHPQNLGAFNNLPLVEQFYDSCDLMIIAGSRVRGHETRESDLALPARRVQIDIDAEADGRTYSNDLFVCADAEATLSALADRLAGNTAIEPGFKSEVAQLKQDTIAAYIDYLGPYGSFAARLRKVMPDDALWVRDITLANSTWGNRLFPLNKPEDSVYSLGAAIGLGVAQGIGAAIGAERGGSGRKTVAMCGDGGFFMGFAEFWTAAQENADIVFLVMNDQGYGVIKHIQDTFHDGRHYFANFQNPDLASLASTAGMPYQKVESAEDLDGAMAAALAVDGPALVEVDMASVGEFPRYFIPPPTMVKA